ncbi:MAG: hypothetical protein PF487_00110 [Bacteroidales bacterium]|jgi:hypothetical protein|nr:hypothetical protein [Bacteroidales bacterium]
MFWKREKKVANSLGGLPLLIPPIPPKKEYIHIFELLKEAEYFSNTNDKNIEAEHLDILVKAIERYKSNAI